MTTHPQMKVHCLFEQSGTFKNQFKELGYEAYDYDLQNNFGETDFQIDLFTEIENGYQNRPSIFDQITENDLVMAFFPCIYFETMSMMYFDLSTLNIRKKSKKDTYKIVMERILNRETFYKKLWELYALCDIRGLRLIIENPGTQPHYLTSFQNFPKPTFIDKNRALRGDYFAKPTAYWFVNMKPTYGHSYCINPKPKRVNDMKSAPRGGYAQRKGVYYHPLTQRILSQTSSLEGVTNTQSHRSSQNPKNQTHRI